MATKPRGGGAGGGEIKGKTFIYTYKKKSIRIFYTDILFTRHMADCLYRPPRQNTTGQTVTGYQTDSYTLPNRQLHTNSQTAKLNTTRQTVTERHYIIYIYIMLDRQITDRKR